MRFLLLLALTIAFASDGAGIPSCRERHEKIPALRLFFALPPGGLAHWSSDFLLQSVLAIEQDYLPFCTGTIAEHNAVDQMKRGYLEKLGLSPPKIADREVEPLFRGLVAPEEDQAALKKRLAASSDLRDAKGVLRSLYGEAETVRGSWLLGASPAAVHELTTLLDTLCGSEKGGSPEDCVFWNGTLIDKALVTPQSGLAAYIPETATLVLSSDLLEHPSLLTHVVITHELVHVAARAAWLRTRRDWGREFMIFSGWRRGKKGALELKVRELGPGPQDEVAKLSPTSAFSILPDPVLKPDQKDGFVLAKAYRETKENHEPAEDLADHGAIYRWVPERYCYAGTELAPKKWAWVRKNLPFVGYSPPKLSCLKAVKSRP